MVRAWGCPTKRFPRLVRIHVPQGRRAVSGVAGRRQHPEDLDTPSVARGGCRNGTPDGRTSIASYRRSRAAHIFDAKHLNDACTVTELLA